MATRCKEVLTVSVVSHGQAGLVEPLLGQLRHYAAETSIRIVLTENLPEVNHAHIYSAAADVCIENSAPKGFGANHNAAFAYCTTPYFCVVNPDIRLLGNPFPALIEALRQNPGVAAPRVVDQHASLEDSARRVPTVGRLLRRACARLQGQQMHADYRGEGVMQVDWVAGMFLLFDAEAFRRLGGFDDRYHLYCEDVDICLRSWLNGYTVSWVNQAVVRHDAQRDSHRQFRYLRWHVASIIKLLSSETYWRFRQSFRGTR